MNESIECLKGFLDAVIEKNEEKVKRYTQGTWIYRYGHSSIIELLPNIEEYVIGLGMRDADSVYTYKISINNNEYSALARVIREVAPYKPDPNGENGQWGVNPKSIINTLLKID